MNTFAAKPKFEFKPTVRPNVRQVAKEEASKFASIAENPFHKILLGEGKPQEKKEAMTKALTFTGDKAKDRANIAAFVQIGEFFQEKRKQMEREGVNAINTEVTSYLQGVYKDLTDRMHEFEEKLKPLTDILNSVNTLRNNGVIFDTLKDIKSYNAARAQAEEEAKTIEHEMSFIKNEIEHLEKDLNAARSDTILGFIKPSAKSRANEIEIQISNRIKKLDELIETAKAKTAEPVNVPAGEFAAETKALADFINLSSDETKALMVDLISTTNEFIDTAEEKVEAVGKDLDQKVIQMDQYFDTTKQLNAIHSIMATSLTDAEKENLAQRAKLETKPENENELDGMMRTDKLDEIHNHINLSNGIKVETINALGEIQRDTGIVQSLRDATRAQKVEVRKIASQGISGTAARLRITLEGVAGAAVGEAAAGAAEHLKRMNQTTIEMAQSQVMRNVMSVNEENQRASDMIEQLVALNDVYAQATTAKNEAYAALSENMEQMRQMKDEVAARLSEADAVVANVASRSDSAPVKKSPETKSAAFDLGA